MAVFSFLHTGRCTYVYILRARPYYDTCVPLHLRHMRASISTNMYVHVRDQNDNATYASTRWVPTVRHFLACEDVAGGSHQSGCESFFLPGRTSLLRLWTQLSASPCTVHVQWKPFLDHVDHAAQRAPGRWTMARPRKGMTRSRGRRGSGCPRVEEYEGTASLWCEAAVSAE